jgi:hypothetical protein
MDIIASESNIELIKGNLLDFPGQINNIAHSCNTKNVMGAGIAKQIKERYPLAYSADCNAKHDNANILGAWSFGWTDPSCTNGIYNMYTQEEIGAKRSVDYEGFHCALEQVADYLDWRVNEGKEFICFGLPYGISCGLAGGSSRIINTIIHEILTHRSFKTYIVKYE